AQARFVAGALCLRGQRQGGVRVAGLGRLAGERRARQGRSEPAVALVHRGGLTRYGSEATRLDDDRPVGTGDAGGDVCVRPAGPRARFDARGGRRAVGAEHPAGRVPARHPRLGADHPWHPDPRPRRGRPRGAGRLVRDRGPHRVCRLRRQVAHRVRRHAYRHYGHSRGFDRHDPDRDHEPAQVLADGHDAGDDHRPQGQVRGAGVTGDPVLSLRRRGVPPRGTDHVRAALPVWETMIEAVRRLGGWAVRGLAGTAMLLTSYPPNRLTAQDSQYGIRGLGTPGRWESVRARSTGGAFAPFDLTSPLMEASLADAGRLVAGAMEGASYRRSELAGTAASLRETRFPLMGLSGQVFGRLAVSGGFTTYLDRSWDVTIRDTVVLRGTPQPSTDEIASDGGVADLRLAAATRLRSWLAVGAG